MAWVGFTEGLQPEMVPASVANRNSACPLLPPALTWKPVPWELVKTVPVGPPATATVRPSLA